MNAHELGWVYFVGTAEESPVKVGWSLNAHMRLGSLQTAHWEPLMLLGRIRGTLALEAEAHNALADHRVRGEWFERGPALTLYAMLREGESPHLEGVRARSLPRTKRHFTSESSSESVAAGPQNREDRA